MIGTSRIWFNRGFSLGPIAALMRAADPSIEVFASVSAEGLDHSGPTRTWLDGGETDPCDTEAYLNWVRDTIATHAIDIFIPTRRRVLLAGAGLACSVHLPASIETLAVLDDKYRFANSLAGQDYHLPTKLARSADELEGILAGEWAARWGAGICVKPSRGVNGLGFWRLTDVSPMAHLQEPDRRMIRSVQYLSAVREQELSGSMEPLVVMPYLPGPEISFDILAHRGEVLKYAARTKLSTGRQHIVSRHPLDGAVAAIVARFELHGLVNAQFRRAESGQWLLLEINARPAGGVVHADQVGCNMVGDWAGLLTGRITPETVGRGNIDAEVAFSSVATPVAA